MSTLLFDIGGTTMRMAHGNQSENADTIENVKKIPTPEDPNEAIAALAEYAKNIAVNGNVESACGGIAGIITDGVIISSPNLPTWNGFNFSDALHKALGVLTHILNDAEAAAIGEATYGAGKNYSHVAYIGIGTGVGGANVVDKKLASHAHGFEPGRQILDIETGETFEQLVSGGSLEKRYGLEAKELPREIYEDYTPILAAGLLNILVDWSPEVLVLGGSLMNETNGYRIEEVRAALAGMSDVSVLLADIVHSELGDENGLYGALAMAVVLLHATV
jgi:glucokinase